MKFSNLRTWGPLVVQAYSRLFISHTPELPKPSQGDEARMCRAGVGWGEGWEKGYCLNSDLV